MKKNIFFFLLITEFLLINPAIGQNTQKSIDTSATKVLFSTPRRFYFGNGYDFLMVSTSILKKAGLNTKLSTPRFTGFVNIGFNYHFDPNQHIGFFTGIGLKNLGFIDPEGALTTASFATVKRRVYTIGAPLGVKIGDMRNRNFVFLGGGVDVPFNYREKIFIKRHDKIDKNSEWFSKQTATVMPYLFVGASVNPGFVVKASYYPGNFMNPDYTITTSTGATLQPYAGLVAQTIVLSFSIDVHYNQYKIQEREYREWKAGKNKQ